MKTKKPKKHGVSYWKTKAWNEFSKYIRRKECLKYSVGASWGYCYTCGKSKFFNELQAGHYIPGRRPAYLFDERQVHPQCGYCNGTLKGNWPKYYEKMVEEYGRELADELKDKKWESRQFKAFELEEIYNKYKSLNKV